jgi:hypothetical protein
MKSFDKFTREEISNEQKPSTTMIFLSFFVAVFLVCMNSTVQATSPHGRSIVKLGEKFTLHRGEKAVLEGSCLEIEILRFINQPCPPKAKCVWSGVGIEFEYQCRGQVKRGLNLVKAFGYNITVVESDYASYTVMAISMGQE